MAKAISRQLRAWTRAEPMRSSHTCAALGGGSRSRRDRCDALAGAGERPGSCPQADGARDTDASGGERGSDRSARAKLGRAGSQTGRNPGAENPEAEQRQRREHQRQRILERRLVGAESLGELAEQRGSDADDDGEHQHLDAGCDDVAQHSLGEERRLAEEAERHEDEARQRRKLELDQRDEQLYGQDEERDQNDEPRDQQHEDLDEVLEERHEAHELTGGLKDRLAGINPDLCQSSGLQELVGGKCGARGFQAEAGEGIEHDLGKRIEVADQEGEEADIERLLDEVSEDVLAGAPGPEQARERYVDGDQRRREKRDFPTKQAESAVDVAREDLGKTVDDAGVHCGCPAISPGGWGALEFGVEGDWGALVGNSFANGDAGSSTSGVARTG